MKNFTHSGAVASRYLLHMMMAVALAAISFTSKAQTVRTDLDDYPPGSTAIITGTGFQPGENVELHVHHADGDPMGTDPEHHQPWYVTADSEGNFTTSWYVPTAEEGDALGATLRLEAHGDMGSEAEWIFTDAVQTRITNIYPSSGDCGESITISATLEKRLTAGNPGTWGAVSGAIITFTFVTASPETTLVTATGTTNSSGIASVSMTVPSGAAKLKVAFGGSGSGQNALSTDNVSIIFAVTNTPSVSVTSSSVCTGGSATISATGSPSGGSYLWSTGETSQSISVSPTSTTSYSVTYTNGACTASGSGTVTVNPIPSASIDSNYPQKVCYGSDPTVNLTGTPNATVKYKLNSGPEQSITLNNGGNGNFVITNITMNTIVELTDVSLAGCSQSLSASATVTLESTPPTITCPGNISVNGTSAAGAVVNYDLPTATDICPGTPSLSLIAGLASGSTFPLGTTTVTYQATDAAGNTASCSFDVTVTGVPPSITCPDNITASNDAGQCGADVSFAASETTGIPVSTITYTVDGNLVTSGSFFPVGTTTVTATATNAVGSSSCTFDVTVTDNENPTIVGLSVDISVNNDAGVCGAAVSWTAPISDDNCADHSIAQIAGLASGSVFPVGTTTVTYEAMDAAGNTYSASFDVTVSDNEAPVITTNGDKSVNNDAGLCSAAVTVSASAADNCGVGSPSGVRSDALALTDPYPVGVTTIKWSVTDVNSNDALKVEQTITVTDNEAPTVITQNVTIYLDGDGNASTSAAAVNNGSSDNCGIESISLSKTDFTCDDVGENTVTLTVTDVNGNSASADATVTVVDNIIPEWTTPAGSLNVSVSCGHAADLAAAQALMPEAIDNCGIASIVKTAGSLLNGPNGTYTNTFIATDINGNISAVFTQVITITPVSVDANGSSIPVPVGSAATLTASVSPAEAGITVNFYLNDVLLGSSLTNASGIATYNAGVLAVGVYKVGGIVGSGCSESEAYLPVYDPNGGFVTGGGWINSPAGAYVADANLVGKANFGFVSKYKKGSNTVEGNTEFQFHAGSLNFKSTMHNAGTLVIAGAKAIYKGVGTINGTAGYSFMVSAIDGHVTGGGGVDKFRIKIWATSGGAVVYDNQLGADENVDATTVLGGGSIVIHTPPKKGNGREASPEEAVTMESITLEAYPNPMRSKLTLLFANPEKAPVAISMMDMSGRNMSVKISETAYGAEIDTHDLTNGFYYLRVRVGNAVQGLKVMKQE